MKRPNVRATDPFGSSSAPTMSDLMSVMLDDVPVHGITPAPYVDQDVIVAYGFRLTGVGLVQAGEVQVEDWQLLGSTLTRLEGALQWLIGDWVNIGAATWSYAVRDIAMHINRDVKTIQNWVSVVRAVPLEMRRPELSYAHHEVVAGLADMDAKAAWLQAAVENGWSVTQLRTAMRPKAIRPAATSAPARQFARALPSVERRLKPLFEQASVRERKDMALELRRLADRLEKQD